MCTVLVSAQFSSCDAFNGAGGGVPWDEIMENEFEYLSDREGHSGHLAEKFFFVPIRIIAVTVSRFACLY